VEGAVDEDAAGAEAERRAVEREGADQAALGTAGQRHDRAAVADRVGEDEEAERRAAAAERLEGGPHRGDVEGVVADRAGDQQDFA